MELDMTVARKAAEEAVEAAQQVISDFLARGDWHVTLKSDQSPVTEVDVAAEKAIKQVLTKALPNAAFFGEETGKSAATEKSGKGAGLRWLVDPIDGTKSFIRGSRYYSTQIALEVDDELRLGVSNAPAYGEKMVAVHEQGAWLDGRQVHCNDITSIDDAFFSSGNLTTLARDADAWSRYAQIVGRVRRVRGYGDFCHYHQLCSGQADLILESDVNILDIAALTVAVREAGGIITDMHGQAVNEATTSVLAACSVALHEQALDLLHG
ncbi:Histidinol-phosphatase [Granulosicoccus antarcticus IMCC3135]|uniref:Histidinol-phosphatase n=1 Tax=Granulosicoccus antarcticus IMCC3135 TaxID=1192854 RepID=A0A2Z2NYN5_9GAMM|nr:Histidinol-phosphatase [Granulosicoccus antarcticus IMCC3135]